MKHLTRFAALLLVAGLIFGIACGDDDDDGDGGNGDTQPTATTAAGGNGGNGGGDGPSLEGASFSVGSKEFTEQLILGHMTRLALENAGATVEDNIGITGTQNVRTALTSGEIDMYWEYTGTGWSSHLGREIAEAPSDPMELFEQVKEADAANGIVWMDPAPLNNTYALVTAASRSEEMGITTISDFAELANTSPDQASLCGATEWLTRDDGYPGLEEAYGFDLPDDQIAEVEFSLINSLVAAGEECNFGEAFATDGSIVANDLIVLEDDKNYFVAYNGALTVRQDVFDEHGDALQEIFGPISEQLTDETMQQLNARVDVDGELPEDVARDFLTENGFIN